MNVSMKALLALANREAGAYFHATLARHFGESFDDAQRVLSEEDVSAVTTHLEGEYVRLVRMVASDGIYPETFAATLLPRAAASAPEDTKQSFEEHHDTIDDVRKSCEYARHLFRTLGFDPPHVEIR